MVSATYPNTERYASEWGRFKRRNRGLGVIQFVLGAIGFTCCFAVAITVMVPRASDEATLFGFALIEYILAFLSVAIVAMTAFGVIALARANSENLLARSMGTTVAHMRAAARLLSLRSVIKGVAISAETPSEPPVAARLAAARFSFERRLDAILSLSEGLDGASGSHIGQNMISDMLAEADRIEIDAAAASEAAVDCAELSRMLNDQARDKARAMILARMPKA